MIVIIIVVVLLIIAGGAYYVISNQPKVYEPIENIKSIKISPKKQSPGNLIKFLSLSSLLGELDVQITDAKNVVFKLEEIDAEARIYQMPIDISPGRCIVSINGQEIPAGSLSATVKATVQRLSSVPKEVTGPDNIIFNGSGFMNSELSIVAEGDLGPIEAEFNYLDMTDNKVVLSFPGLAPGDYQVYLTSSETTEPTKHPMKLLGPPIIETLTEYVLPGGNVYMTVTNVPTFVRRVSVLSKGKPLKYSIITDLAEGFTLKVEAPPTRDDLIMLISVEGSAEIPITVHYRQLPEVNAPPAEIIPGGSFEIFIINSDNLESIQFRQNAFGDEGLIETDAFEKITENSVKVFVPEDIPTGVPFFIGAKTQFYSSVIADQAITSAVPVPVVRDVFGCGISEGTWNGVDIPVCTGADRLITFIVDSSIEINSNNVSFDMSKGGNLVTTMPAASAEDIRWTGPDNQTHRMSKLTVSIPQELGGSIRVTPIIGGVSLEGIVVAVKGASGVLTSVFPESAPRGHLCVANIGSFSEDDIGDGSHLRAYFMTLDQEDPDRQLTNTVHTEVVDFDLVESTIHFRVPTNIEPGTYKLGIQFSVGFPTMEELEFVVMHDLAVDAKLNSLVPFQLNYIRLRELMPDGTFGKNVFDFNNFLTRDGEDAVLEVKTPTGNMRYTTARSNRLNYVLRWHGSALAIIGDTNLPQNANLTFNLFMGTRRIAPPFTGKTPPQKVKVQGVGNYLMKQRKGPDMYISVMVPNDTPPLAIRFTNRKDGNRMSTFYQSSLAELSDTDAAEFKLRTLEVQETSIGKLKRFGAIDPKVFRVFRVKGDPTPGDIFQVYLASDIRGKEATKLPDIPAWKYSAINVINADHGGHTNHFNWGPAFRCAILNGNKNGFNSSLKEAFVPIESEDKSAVFRAKKLLKGKIIQYTGIKPMIERASTITIWCESRKIVANATAKVLTLRNFNIQIIASSDGKSRRLRAGFKDKYRIWDIGAATKFGVAFTQKDGNLDICMYAAGVGQAITNLVIDRRDIDLDKFTFGSAVSGMEFEYLLLEIADKRMPTLQLPRLLSR